MEIFQNLDSKVQTRCLCYWWNQPSFHQVVLLLPLLLVPLVDSTSDASTFPILRYQDVYYNFVLMPNLSDRPEPFFLSHLRFTKVRFFLLET